MVEPTLDAIYVSPKFRKLRTTLTLSDGKRHRVQFVDGSLRLSDPSLIHAMDLTCKETTFRNMGIVKVDKAAAEQVALAHKAKRSHAAGSKGPHQARGDKAATLRSEQILAQAADQNLNPSGVDMKSLTQQLSKEGSTLVEKTTPPVKKTSTPSA